MLLTKLPPFQNVGAGQTAILPSMPVGRTYFGLKLQLGGTFTKANISQIRVSLAGKEFVRISGALLDAINQYNLDGGDTSTELTLYFGDPKAKTIIGQMIGAVDTSIFNNANDNFNIEVDIAAGATSPTLECWGLVFPPKAENDINRATIRSLISTTHTSAGAAGEFSLPIPVGSIGGSILRGIHFSHGGNVEELNIRKDGVYVLQNGTNQTLRAIQKEFGRENQSNVEVADFVLTGNQSEGVKTLRQNGSRASFEFDVTTSAADTITTVTDMYSSIARV